MAQVLIRDLDDSVVERIRAAAKLKGRSLESELREIVTKGAAPSPVERAARLAAFQSKYGLIHLTEDPVDIIREERERRGC